MDMRKMLKQAQQAQAQMTQMQDELANETVDASSGGGMVKVTMTGAQELVSIKIDPEAVDPDDIELLEDMILAAVNEASRASGELANAKMQSITGGLNLPGLM